MKYMLLIYLEENSLDDATRVQCYQESTAVAHAMHASGNFIAAAPLHPTTTATSVRVRNGKSLVTDGPFAETREQLGGYFLVEANDLDEAIAMAERVPGAKFGTIEVRPIIELAGVPGNS